MPVQPMQLIADSSFATGTMTKSAEGAGAGVDPANDSSCNLSKVLMFLSALTAGTVCSLTSKILLSMKSTGMTGEVEDFSYPLFQTTGMFLGMTAGLFFHFLVMWFRIPFPGYTHATNGAYSAISGTDEEGAGLVSSQPGMKPLPMWMYFFLIFPSVFDLVATSLAMYGLRYVTVSVYQMLRGSAIVFVALLKQFVLKDVLKRYMWVGIALNVLSIVMVGFTAMMIEASGASAAGAEGEGAHTDAQGGSAIVGVVLILMGAFVQSLQYVFEEKVMSASEDDPNVAPTPPLLLIGMEGLWGLLICVFILYPIAYWYPGEDHGSFENPFNTYTMIANSPQVQGMFVLYFFAILFYNVLACLVTYMLDSVWHAILDNFRPATVWGTDMFIFYCVTSAFGEPWNQPWSLLQLAGMAVLLYGTAIYNAPNPGSVKLTGGAASCFIDCSDEYEERLPVVMLAAPDTPLRAGSKVGEVVVSANPSPHYSTMSPFLAGNQRRLMISPAQQQRVGGTPLGVRRQGGEGGNERYVAMVAGTPGRHGHVPALSGNSSNLLSSQQVGRGMSFGYGSNNVVAAGSPGAGAVQMGYTNYGR